MTIYVLKFGTKALMASSDDSDYKLDIIKLKNIASVANYLYKQKNIFPVIVTSGAMLVGMENKDLVKSMGYENLKKLPKDVKDKQRLAQYGWSKLIDRYGECFKEFGLMVPGEFLLTHNNFANENERENIKNIICDCFTRDEVPIINTNDALTDEELISKYNGKTFSDNDGLASLVAKCTQANRLYLFSDVDGVYTKKPEDKDAKRIKEIYHKNITQIIKQLKEEGCHEKESILSRGGIISKLEAALSSNIDTIIGHVKDTKRIVSCYDLEKIQEFATVIYRKKSFIERTKEDYKKPKSWSI